jgi:hypothetical protein
VRGFGPVKDKALAGVRQRWATLLEAFRNENA